jgi:hypothetical protein
MLLLDGAGKRLLSIATFAAAAAIRHRIADRARRRGRRNRERLAMNAVASRNVKFISHCDQGGRGDGVQIMVHRGYAYIGHGYSRHQRH